MQQKHLVRRTLTSYFNHNEFHSRNKAKAISFFETADLLLNLLGGIGPVHYSKV